MGVSINQLATLAIAEKVSALETADYLLDRASLPSTGSPQSWVRPLHRYYQDAMTSCRPFRGIATTGPI